MYMYKLQTYTWNWWKDINIINLSFRISEGWRYENLSGISPTAVKQFPMGTQEKIQIVQTQVKFHH